MSGTDSIYQGYDTAHVAHASKPSTRPASAQGIPSVSSSAGAKSSSKSSSSGEQHRLTAEALRMNDKALRGGTPSGSRDASGHEADVTPLPEGRRSSLSLHSSDAATSKKSGNNGASAQGQQLPGVPDPLAPAPTEPPTLEPSKAGSRTASVASSARINTTSALARKHAAAAATAAVETAELATTVEVTMIERTTVGVTATAMAAAGDPAVAAATAAAVATAAAAAAAAQDLRAEARPWNELKMDSSASPSAVNSIASYGKESGAGGDQELDASRVSSRQTSARSTHRSVANRVGAAPEPHSRPFSMQSWVTQPAEVESFLDPPRKTPFPQGSKAGSMVRSNRSSGNGGGRQSANGVQKDFSRPPALVTNSEDVVDAAQRPQTGEASRSQTASSLTGFRLSTGSKQAAGKADLKMPVFDQLPWSTQAMSDFRLQMRKSTFHLLHPADDPLTARMDSVFSLPQELWPVLPPGALYCLEASDPRSSFTYFQHTDFPLTKVRVGTYFGKWGRHLVDFVVAFQATPRAEAAFQPGNGKQAPLPWEPRQVVAHTTNGEYQYANTRMRFRGPKGPEPDAPMVEWCDAHGIDLLDTKAANEHAPRNSDKDRDAHLIDPPRPNTWGEMARRPLVSNLRSRGGGAYVHHINYDNSGLRTTCDRRVPAGYFFTLAPNAPPKTPAVPGCHRLRASSCGRSLANSKSRAPLAPTSTSVTGAGAEASGARLEPSHSLLSGVLAQGSVPALLSGLAASAAAAGAEAGAGRPTSASVARSRPSSAGSQGAPQRLPQLMSVPTWTTLESFRSGSPWAVASAAQLNRESSRAITATGPSLFSLTPKSRWRTYDVPFHHPVHTARASDLGMALALAAGTGVRSFSDTAAVLKVAEEEMRLTRPFVPGPLVVNTWGDVPRLYAEHMAAARALMPVTELDMYASSKLHQLIYHLQQAATLEFDRLDAKLLLLPQMARLGRKSAEFDAWLQVIVEHAHYLYEKLQITDTSRWASMATPPAPAPTPSAAAGTDANAAGGPAPLLRRSVTFSKAAPLVSPTGAPSFAFPEPLVGTSYADRSALNVAAQNKPPLPEQSIPVHLVSVEEWAAVAKIMDTTRHAILHDQWVRLRPLMVGAAQPCAYTASRPGSTYIMSEACATIHDFDVDFHPPESEFDSSFAHGKVNRELLDYVQEDMAAMNSPSFTPPPPPPDGGLPRARGYRGSGPLPPEMMADMPTVHRPVRCRGTDETPLPEEFDGVDLWNIRNKTDQVTSSPGEPSLIDVGAVRFSQVSIQRLQEAKSFGACRQAEVWRSMQRAAGEEVWDEESAPYYGSDIAEDVEVMSMTSASSVTRRRRAKPTAEVPGVVSGLATQTTDELDGPSPAEQVLEDATKAREAREAAESRRRLLTGNGGKTRKQILEEALRSAEAAIESLKPRPIPASEPETPRGYTENGEPYDNTWRPYGSGHGPYSRGLESPSRGFEPVVPFAQPYGHKANNKARQAKPESYGKGPEPFSLEKINAEPSVLSEHEAVIMDVPKASANNFGGVNIGIGGLVDYETAMARRRAIAGAEVAHDRSDFIPQADVLTLFVTYCNLGGHPELVEMLQRAIDAPMSTAHKDAVATAHRVVASQASMTRRVGALALVKQKAEEETEAERQRIRATAWLLGVTWRRITNETYTSFLCRVLGWPAEMAMSLHRTRATQIIARALVRGHDTNSVPKTPRH